MWLSRGVNHGCHCGLDPQSRRRRQEHGRRSHGSRVEPGMTAAFVTAPKAVRADFQETTMKFNPSRRRWLRPWRRARGLGRAGLRACAIIQAADHRAHGATRHFIGHARPHARRAIEPGAQPRAWWSIPGRARGPRRYPVPEATRYPARLVADDGAELRGVPAAAVRAPKPTFD